MTCDLFSTKPITHGGWDKLAAILEMASSSSTFSSMKMFKFWLKFHWSLFLAVQLTLKISFGLSNGLALNRWWTITSTTDGAYASPDLCDLTHWGRDKSTAILQTFAGAFSSMKMYEFWFRFHWRLFLKVQSTRRQTIIWTNNGWFTDAYLRRSAPMS